MVFVLELGNRLRLKHASHLQCYAIDEAVVKSLTVFQGQAWPGSQIFAIGTRLRMNQPMISLHAL